MKILYVLSVLCLPLAGCAIKNHTYGVQAPAADVASDGRAIIYLVRPGMVGFAVN